MNLICLDCLPPGIDVSELDSDRDLECSECGNISLCVAVPDHLQTGQPPPREDDDPDEDEVIQTSHRPFTVHPERPAVNGHPPVSGSGYYLYLERERRANKLYQFGGRPSPGDLKRIERGTLRVFSCRDGVFREVTGMGTETDVEVFGEPDVSMRIDVRSPELVWQSASDPPEDSPHPIQRKSRRDIESEAIQQLLSDEPDEVE